MPRQNIIDEPMILSEILTEYGNGKELRSVSCLTENKLWTRGHKDPILKLYNLQGELLESIQTKSGNAPTDIAVAQNGDLVYADFFDKSINIIKNKQIRLLVKLRGWKPLNLCITSSGDLLVSMVSIDRKQSKVVRYSGSEEKQNIQWDDQGEALYPDPTYIFLSENKNSDICVADWKTGTIMVFCAAGNLRFQYPEPPFVTMKPFQPFGIATDSESRILIADCNNHRIHILDQDGNFLRYIQNLGLEFPAGLCLDCNDNLFLAEYYTGIVKKIQYSQ